MRGFLQGIKTRTGSIVALKEFPVADDHIFLDKLSGKDFNCPCYKTLLDTRAKGKDLTGTFIADLVLQILSYVAETERANIRQRQKEGIAAARMRGIQFGRPRKRIPNEFWNVKLCWEEGKISSRQAAKQLNIAQNTFLRWVHGR